LYMRTLRLLAFRTYSCLLFASSLQTFPQK
jgi:hypothetical protein